MRPLPSALMHAPWSRPSRRTGGGRDAVRERRNVPERRSRERSARARARIAARRAPPSRMSSRGRVVARVGVRGASRAPRSSRRARRGRAARASCPRASCRASSRRAGCASRRRRADASNQRASAAATESGAGGLALGERPPPVELARRSSGHTRVAAGHDASQRDRGLAEARERVVVAGVEVELVVARRAQLAHALQLERIAPQSSSRIRSSSDRKPRGRGWRARAVERRGGSGARPARHARARSVTGSAPSMSALSTEVRNAGRQSRCRR